MKLRTMFTYSALIATILLTSTTFAEDTFPVKAVVRYAKGFTIEYHDTYKLVTVLNPWQGAGVTYQYLLVQRGTPPPSGYAHLPTIEVPVRSMITTSTTHLAYLDQLDRLDALVGYSTFQHVNTPNVLNRIAAGKLKEIGAGQSINVELIMDLNPEVIMTYAVGTPDDEHFKLREAHLTIVLNGEYTEQTPLGRAEWIKFLAAFFNQETRADAVFDAIATEYEALAAKTQQLIDQPTVFLNAPYNGEWWIPGGHTYMAKFLKDAGARYLWADDTSTVSRIIDFEAIYEQAAEADFWLHPGTWERLRDGLVIDDRLAQFRAFQQGNVYNNNARVNQYGGNDYWESGLTRPDIVLADLITIFHPELAPGHEFVYYKKLN